jgi:hypothetical protein
VRIVFDENTGGRSFWRRLTVSWTLGKSPGLPLDYPGLLIWNSIYMAYGLMWTARDKAAIKAELDALRTLGHDGEIGRLMAYLASVASYGASAVSQNVHMHVGRQILHSACPFGTVGVFYAYDGPPTKDIYILAFCTNVFTYVGTAAARITNIP